MGRLEGKVTLVTGAASGIGYACALRFAEEGAAVVGSDLVETPEWDRVASAAKGSQFHIVDVRDEAAQNEMAAKAKIENSQNNTAINIINDFIKKVQNQRGKQILESAADALIASAQEIITLLKG